MNDIRTLLGGASYVFACRVMGAVAAVVTQILLARWMGAEQLGIYLYAFALCVLLSMLGGLGLPGPTTFRFIGIGLANDDSGLIRGFVRRGTQIGVSFSIIIMIAGIAVVSLVSQKNSAAHSTVMVLAFIIVPFYFLFSWFGGIAQSLRWKSLAFLPELVIRPVLLLMCVCLLWYGGHMLTPVTVMSWHLTIIIAVVAVQALLLRRALSRQLPPATPQPGSRKWLRTALPLLITAIFVKCYLELNLILVGQYLSSDQIAIFNAAFRTAFLIGFAIQAVNATIVPNSAELHAAGDFAALQSAILRGTQVQVASALTGLGVFILVGRFFLSLFGAEFEAGYQAMLILAVSQVVVAGFGPGAQLLNVSGNQKYCLVVYASTAVLLFVLHALLTTRFGINGAAFAVLISLMIQSFWINLIAVRRLQIRPSILGNRRLADYHRASGST